MLFIYPSFYACIIFLISSCLALYEGCVSYFPIELSYVCVGRWSYYVFAIGITFITFTTWCINLKYLSSPGRYELITLSLSYLGVVILALFDDKRFSPIHLFGTFVFVMASCLDMIIFRIDETYIFLTISLMFIILIIVSKALVVMLFEAIENEGEETEESISVARRVRVFMLRGNWQSHYTGVVFRVTAVMQWLVILMLMRPFDYAIYDCIHNNSTTFNITK